MHEHIVGAWIVRTNPQRLRLEGEICHDCSKKIFPPRDICPNCSGIIYQARKPDKVLATQPPEV